MKIGFDIRPLQENKKSGVGEFTYELLAALFKIDSKNEYHLFSNAQNIDKIGIPPAGAARVKHHHFKIPNKWLNSKFKFFNAPKIDQLMGVRLDFFVFPNINFYALSPGIKKILVMHDLSYEIYPNFYSPKSRLWHALINSRKFCEDAEKIVAVSENTKKDLVNIFKIATEKIQTIYPGIDRRYFDNIETVGLREKYNLPEKFILFLGTVEPRKNVSGLISAFNRIKSTIPQHLVIAGARGYRAGKILAGSGERTRYINYVADADKPGLYKLADALVFPSFYEGFGFPPLEALAAGTPVVASHTGSLGEVLADAALLVNPRNDAELGRAIINILQNNELREQLLARAGRVLQKYSWEEAAKKILEIIK